jgi:hypothetical protein
VKGLDGVSPEAVAAALAGKVPALDDEAFAAKQAVLRRQLGALGAEALEL